jgi:hypothetical protein
MLQRRIVLWAAGLAVIAAGSAQACSDHSSKTAATTYRRPASASALVAWKPRAWAPALSQGQSGFQVAIDPVDGAMGMPAVDESPQLMVPADEAPVALTRRLDGSYRAQLDERWADFAVVNLGTDGKPRWTCVHGSKQADKFMLAPTVPAAPGTVWVEK